MGFIGGCAGGADERLGQSMGHPRPVVSSCRFRGEYQLRVVAFLFSPGCVTQFSILAAPQLPCIPLHAQKGGTPAAKKKIKTARDPVLMQQPPGSRQYNDSIPGSEVPSPPCVPRGGGASSHDFRESGHHWVPPDTAPDHPRSEKRSCRRGAEIVGPHAGATCLGAGPSGASIPDRSVSDPGFYASAAPESIRRSEPVQRAVVRGDHVARPPPRNLPAVTGSAASVSAFGETRPGGRRGRVSRHYGRRRLPRASPPVV